MKVCVLLVLVAVICFDKVAASGKDISLEQLLKRLSDNYENSVTEKENNDDEENKAPEGETDRLSGDNGRNDEDLGEDVTDGHHLDCDAIRQSCFQKPKCGNGRCECEDPNMKANFLAGVGNVVAKCQAMKMQAIMQNITSKTRNKRAPKANKKMSETKQFNFYLATCMHLAAIGQQIKDRTFEMKIRSCGDYEQLLNDLNCLNTYMTLVDMSRMRAQFVKVTKKPLSTDSMIERLEQSLKMRCDALYRNRICLVMELTNHVDKNTCADVPTMKSGLRPKGGKKDGDSETDKYVDTLMDDDQSDMQSRFFYRLPNPFQIGDPCDSLNEAEKFKCFLMFISP